MNKLLKGVAMVSLLAGCSSCSDTFDPTSDRDGRIVLDLSVSSSVAAPSAARTRAASVREITVEDLQLALRATAGGYEFTWPSITAFDPAQDFPVGAYTFEAYYGTKGDEGFDKPYYYGSTQLSIRENETTPVSVTARLANAMVSVVYTDAFADYFSTYSTELQTSKGANISFAADETEAAYVEPGHIEVFANVTKPNGIGAKLSAAAFEAEARHHYIVTLDVDAGSGALNITFNSDLVSETIEIDVTDDVLSAPAPTLAASGFNVEEPIEVVEGSFDAVEAIRMIATAYGEVSTGVLTTVSDALAQKGWPATVDFGSAEASTLATVKNGGLKEYGFTGVKSQMAMLDLTDVIPTIPYVADGDNTTTFTLIVKDKYSKVSDPLTLTVVIDMLKMNVVSTEPLEVGDAQLTFTLEYNGTNIDKALQVQLKNARGTWDNAEISSITPTEGGTYTVVVATPETGSVEFRCVSGSVMTEPVKVIRKGISVDERDVFATTASGLLYFDASMEASEAMGATEFYISTDDDSYSKTEVEADGARFKLSGLTPGTTYYIKPYIDGRYYRAVKFTTEANLQVPNADMETWSTGRSQANGNWYEYFPNGDTENAGPWGTMNQLTTSEGSTGSGRQGCGYCAKSGTSPVTEDDAYNGTSAMIQSVGWGEGNTALSLFVWLGTCENTTFGELYLGTYNEETKEPNYSGIEFASRPMSVSFQAKYVPKNSSDYGYAEVIVLDKSGSVIVSKSMTISSTPDYTLMTLPLEYTYGMNKADRLVLKFKSSDNYDCLDFSTSNYDTPPSGSTNTSKGYEGSKLYIDDITLNY